MALLQKRASVSLSFTIDATANLRDPTTYPTANKNQALEKELTRGLVAWFQAPERRKLFSVSIDPDSIFDSSGVLNKDIASALTREFLIMLPSPTQPPILVPLTVKTKPGPLARVIYMYVGPHEHRIIYQFDMDVQFFQGKKKASALLTSGLSPGIQAMVSWAQPVAEVLDFSPECMCERMRILEETAKIDVKAHGG